MRLLSIECEYFRQHVDSRISFESGLTGIVGANGAGKSTLVEAVAFALFGSTAVRGKADGIVTRGVKRKRPKVRLRFEHGGHGFVVERSLTAASLFMGGNKEAMVTGGRPVTERVQEILGLSHDEFIATYFTEQKGLEFLSGKRGATERSRFIIKMMGYDKLERAQELLRKDRRDLKNQVSGIESTLQDEAELQERVQVEKQQLKEIKEELKTEAQKVKKAETEFAGYEQSFQALEKQKSLFDEKKSTITGLEAKIEAGAKSLLDIEQQLPELEVELSELEGKLSRWNGAFEVFAEEHKALKIKIADAKEKIASAASSWEEQRVTVSAALEVAKVQLETEQKSRKELESLKDEAECPTCGQALGEAYVETFEKSVGRCSHAEANFSKQKLELAEARSEPDELRALKVALEELQAKEQEYVVVLPVFDQVKRVMKDLERLRSSLSDKKQEQKNLTSQKISLEEGLAKLHFSDEQYAKAKTSYETARKLLEVSRMNRLRHESSAEKRQALLERSQEELQKAKDARLQLEEKKRELLLLDESDTAFTNIRRSLNASIRPRLADLASEFLTDLTDGRYSSVEVGEDFSPTVYEDGEPKPVISGGEQDILNLCVRLALSQLVAERAGHSISLLMLDEVFGSLDENRRYNVLMLLEKLQNRFDQVLLITHLDDIKEGVHHFINVEYDEGSGEVRIDALDSYEMLAMNI